MGHWSASISLFVVLCILSAGDSIGALCSDLEIYLILFVNSFVKIVFIARSHTDLLFSAISEGLSAIWRRSDVRFLNL